MLGRQAFRSITSRATPEIGQPLSNYFRQFSTSSRWEAEDSSNNKGAQGASKPSLRERTKASADEIRSISRTNRPESGTNRFSGVPQAAGQARVVDIKSLPRGGLRGRGRGRGGFRGRGGAAAAGGSRAPGGTGKSVGRGRGKRRGRGGRKGQEGEEGGGKGLRGPRERELDESDRVDPAEKEFDDYVRFGVTADYKPELTAESLAEYMPPVATGSGPKTSTILQNLSHLGTGERVAMPQGLQASNYAAAIQEGGVSFFADARTKAATEAYMQQKRHDEAVAKAKEAAPEGAEPEPVEFNSEPIIKGVEESIKKVILDQAVAGQYEHPKPAVDPVSISRNWHLRSETWGHKQTEAFQAKLTSLLAKAGKGEPKKAAKA